MVSPTPNVKVKKPINNCSNLCLTLLLYFRPPLTTQRRRCYFQTEIRIQLPRPVTRTKRFTSSVQYYVQYCLLNLQKPSPLHHPVFVSSARIVFCRVLLPEVVYYIVYYGLCVPSKPILCCTFLDYNLHYVF